MAEAYKYSSVQGTAGVGSFATLYNTDSAKTAIISTLVVCNTASAAATYRIGLVGPSASASVPAATDGLIAWDATVPARDTVFITVGAALDNNNYVRVASSASTVTFTAFVSEIT